MDSDCRLRIPLSKAGDHATHIEVKVFYMKAGTNWFSGGTEPSGIYASVSPVEIKDGMMSFIIGRGAKIRLADAARLNRKAVAKEFDKVKEQVQRREGAVWELVLKLCIKHELTIGSELGAEAENMAVAAQS